MTSTTRTGPDPYNFFLTSEQQRLLFTALDSNWSPTRFPIVPGNDADPSANIPMTSAVPGSGSGEVISNSFLNTTAYGLPLYHSFGLGFPDATQALPLPPLAPPLVTHPIAVEQAELVELETHEKRHHPDDEDDVDDEEEDDDDNPTDKPTGKSAKNSSKRRDSTGRTPKKPGRKPLMEEPTTKRTAQNRAAQRAFRQRKEQHLQDLKDKVDELEKVSRSTNHENTRLRAQLESVTVELNEYKRTLDSIARMPEKAKRQWGMFGQSAPTNVTDVNFQFEFPKFGLSNARSSSSSAVKSTAGPSESREQSTQLDVSFQPARNGVDILAQTSPNPDSLGRAPHHYSPSVAASATRSLDFFRASIESSHIEADNRHSTSSPSVFSQSTKGTSSSSGTSPESLTQSPPEPKPVDGLATIGEEQNNPVFGNVSHDISSCPVDYGDGGLDWLSQQNGGQFDPQLFGDYRDPQENSLETNLFGDNSFNDTFDVDFVTPFFTAPSPILQKSSNLIAEIDAHQNAADDDTPPLRYSCYQLWEKIQSCPKVQRGEINMDNLCAELTKKATCSGYGPTVAEPDFTVILNRFLGPNDITAKPLDAVNLSPNPIPPTADGGPPSH